MGVDIEVMNPGDGSTYPTAGQKVTCHYTLTLTNGTKINSSRDLEQPVEFSIGRGEVIAGWDQGMTKMLYLQFPRTWATAQVIEFKR